MSDPRRASEPGPHRLGRLVGLAGLVVALGACVTRVPVPLASGPGAAEPQTAWARILRQHVLDDGRIDFVALRRDPADLDAFVAWVAAHGPATTPGLFPTPAARLAYYINAYNAVAMHAVVTSERRPEEKYRFFLLSAFVIDGRPRSLYALENRVIRPLGDPRVHFALNCLVRGCPRLPREPFDPVRLDAQLDRETRRFLDEPRNVQVDPPLRVVRLNEIFRFYTRDFLAQAPTLVAYVNRYRTEPIPAGYRVRFIPYDWTLHQR
ncbi:MAG TPA: DUF547 domain-containing protein [Candidatus Limnocylindria bacterium]|nr:DUF547 domain-containing protein [Candidatus Limnocylindria bacterium]